MNNATIDNIESRKQLIEDIKKLAQNVAVIKENVCLPYGLSSIQSNIILDIYHHPDATKVTDICKRLNKSTNTISPLINRLVNKGYLEKKQSIYDARVTHINLTRKSEEITEKISADVNDYTWPMFEKLSEEDFSRILDSIKLLLEVTSK